MGRRARPGVSDLSAPTCRRPVDVIRLPSHEAPRLAHYVGPHRAAPQSSHFRTNGKGSFPRSRAQPTSMGRFSERVASDTRDLDQLWRTDVPYLFATIDQAWHQLAQHPASHFIHRRWTT